MKNGQFYILLTDFSMSNRLWSFVYGGSKSVRNRKIVLWKHLDIFQFNRRSIMSKIEVIKKCSHELISLPIQEIIFTNIQIILEIKMYFEGQIFTSF